MLYNKDWDKKTNSVADLLNKAADIIETRGHAKYYLLDSDGLGFCAQGALMSAIGVTDYTILHGGAWAQATRNQDYMNAIAALDSAMDDKWKANGCARNGASFAVVHWNNSVATTKEDVIAKMREVASSLVDA